MATQDGLADSWWPFLDGPLLNQGDLLDDCYIPILLPNFNPLEGELVTLDLEIRSVIVLTQSCDLENGKRRLSRPALFIISANGKKQILSSGLKAAGRQCDKAGLKVCIFSRGLPALKSTGIALR